MRKSIFEMEIRIDIAYEIKKLSEILFEPKSIYCERLHYSLYSFLNKEIFPIWKYKGVFIDLDDFMERTKIDFTKSKCDDEKFLYLLELLINLWPIVETKIDSFDEKYCSKKVFGYMRMNLPLIIEKMNYCIENDGDKNIIVKRDSDVDSIIDLIPDDAAKLLLEYNDIRNNNLSTKKNILKELDLYIEKQKKLYQQIDNDTYNSIQAIVNNMGINHPIKKEPYKSFDEIELINWYNKCFKLMIHLIRKENIIDINNERKSLCEQ